MGSEREPGSLPRGCRGGARKEEAQDAGLRPGSILYRSAVWWLLDTGALVPNREANARAGNEAGAQHRDFAFKITGSGLDMLSRT